MFVHRLLHKNALVKVNHTRPYTGPRRFRDSFLTRLSKTGGRGADQVLAGQDTRNAVLFDRTFRYTVNMK